MLATRTFWMASTAISIKGTMNQWTGCKDSFRDNTNQLPRVLDYTFLNGSTYHCKNENKIMHIMLH